MSTNMLRCLTCGGSAHLGAKYCPTCGEAIDPALVAELQWRYGALNDLDTRIARGEGDHTISQLRDEYRTLYLGARRAPTNEAPAVAMNSEVMRALWGVFIKARGLPVSAASHLTSSETVPGSPGMAAPPVPQRPLAPQPVAPQPAGPVFSWQAFLSEQAIAIMAYMGGFLGLVAMLVFEIGGWQSLDLLVKLGIVIAFYVTFGALGLFMRRVPRLHTVGSAYLGVFALMTPLLALGIYRFGLQAAGFPGAAMLSLASAYAAVIYLALARRTGFITYAYLGWSALVVAVLAVVYWINAPSETLCIALVVASLLLLLPAIFRHIPGASPAKEPAVQIAAATSACAVIGTAVVGIALATRASESPSTAVYALSALSLIPLPSPGAIWRVGRPTPWSRRHGSELSA